MRIHNKTARLVICDGLRIAPGDTVNVPAGREDVVRKATVFEAGLLVEVADAPARPVAKPAKAAPSKSKAAQAKSVEFSRLSVNEAIDRVNAETDFAKLTLWAETETRPAVIDALNKRAEEIAKS